MKHTKGPWKIETYAGGFFKIIKERNKYELPTQCQAANVALIESAPEMLDALVYLIEEEHGMGLSEKDWGKFRALISRARGDK